MCCHGSSPQCLHWIISGTAERGTQTASLPITTLPGFKTTHFPSQPPCKESGQGAMLGEARVSAPPVPLSCSAQAQRTTDRGQYPYHPIKLAPVLSDGAFLAGLVGSSHPIQVSDPFNSLLFPYITTDKGQTFAAAPCWRSKSFADNSCFHT